MSTAVLARGLRKAYGPTEALRGLDLEVPAGCLFGFLGPNGAGKSTAIGVLCTLLRADAGRAEVDGCDVAREPFEVRRRIGMVFQECTLDLELTAEENLRFHAELYGVPRRRARERAAQVLAAVDLDPRPKFPVRTFSGGMRRRLEIARAVMHTPRVLFLDEPTAGLDPQTRATLWEQLRVLRAEHGVTVFLTTHQLQEAEDCADIAILDAGRVVARGAPGDLKAVIGADLVTVRTDDDEAAVRAIFDRFGLRADAGPAGVGVRVADGAGFVPRLCGGLGMPVHAVSVAAPTLDDVFLHHTGRTIREADTSTPSVSDLMMRR